MYGKLSLIMTSSAYVKLFTLRLCLLYLQCNVTQPTEILPQGWLFISVCIAYEASTHVYNNSFADAPMILLSYIVFGKKVKTSFTFLQ